MPHSSSATIRRKIVVFGFDAAESAQIKRILSLIESGYDVVAFTMRRSNMNAEFTPPWRNIHLFNVANEQIVRRMVILFLSLFKIAAHAGELRRADVVIARNFDMLMLAYAGRLLAFRPRLPLIYECLDIHGSFTSRSRSGRLFRFIERMLLKRTQLLEVSSPGFVEHYFTPIQHYAGKVHLLENKIWFGEHVPPRGKPSTIAGGAPWVIGWVGSLRCEPSFRILLEAAETLGDRVRIEMHGNIHRHVLHDFEERIGRLPNIRYHGPYPYPDGLGPVYASCDMVWAQDLWQAGTNSDWLLPNRIYEASYFGSLSVAVAGTETGRKIIRQGLGYVVPEASGGALVTLIESLSRDDVEARRAALLAHDPADFVLSPADMRALVEDAIG